MFLKFCVFLCFMRFELGITWGRGAFEKFGPFQMVLHSSFIKCNLDRNLKLDVSETYIYFYDFSEDFSVAYPITHAARHILDTKKLDKNKKFILFVGGFKSQILKKQETRVREAYKMYPNSYLIMPDHSPYTNNNDGDMNGFKTAVTHVHYIGKALGEMLADLVIGGVSPKNIHAVGHSLGGQMLAHTGTTFYNITGEKIARITALDPAGPCFTKNFIHEQVRAGVAEYVEVYHCNSGGLGSSSILGDIDFIINKRGESQPDCGTPFVPGIFDSPKAATCSHETCIDVWTASVKNKELFPAYSCDNYRHFKKGLCSRKKTLAGAWNPGTDKGIYYVSTKGYDLKSIR